MYQTDGLLAAAQLPRVTEEATEQDPGRKEAHNKTNARGEQGAGARGTASTRARRARVARRTRAARRARATQQARAARQTRAAQNSSKNGFLNTGTLRGKRRERKQARAAWQAHTAQQARATPRNPGRSGCPDKRPGTEACHRRREDRNSRAMAGAQGGVTRETPMGGRAPRRAEWLAGPPRRPNG